MILNKENMIFFFSKSFLWYNQSFAQMCLLIGTVSQVSDVAHGPLVFNMFFLAVSRLSFILKMI